MYNIQLDYGELIMEPINKLKSQVEQRIQRLKTHLDTDQNEFDQIELNLQIHESELFLEMIENVIKDYD